jgi:hypothetical protein
LKIEVFETGTFGCCKLKKVIEQKPGQYGGIGSSVGSKFTVSIIATLSVSRYPGVHQSISRTTIEADYWLITTYGQKSYVCNAADVDDDAIDSVMAKHRLMKRWRQRRTLTAGFNVSSSKV